jgi:hypothetical protein
MGVEWVRTRTVWPIVPDAADAISLKLKVGHKGLTWMGADPRAVRAISATPSSNLCGCLLKPSQEKQDNENDENDADDTNAAVTEAVAVAAEAATESTEQEDDEDDDEDESERHDAVLSFQRREKFNRGEDCEGRGGDGRDDSERTPPVMLKS